MQFDFLVDWLCFTMNQSLLEVAVVIFSSHVITWCFLTYYWYIKKPKLWKKKESRKNLRLLRLNCNFRTILTPIVGLLTGLRTQELYSAYFVHCAELWSEHKMTLRGKNREVWHWSFGKCQNIYCRTVWRFMSLARICDVGQIIANSQISSSLVVSRGTKLCNGDTDFIIFCTNALPLKK